MEQQAMNTTERVTQGNGAAKTSSPDAIPRDARVITPPVDVLENADEVLVLADLPGAKAADMTIRLEKDALVLTAERKAHGGDRPLFYKRIFFVPSDLDADGIEAKLEDGVLTLRFPRRQSAKPRTIPVKTA